MGGDYNVISRDHDPAWSQFLGFEFEFMDRLATLGLIDAHRIKSDTQEHTWVGRTGDGYRYDYFHVGGELANRIAHHEYLHETRGRLTDHSAATLTLKLEESRIHLLDPADENQDTLF